MASKAEVSGARRRMWRWYAALAFFVLVIVGLFYRRAWVKVRADNYRAARITIALVTKFVRENGRWPKSWRELEQMPFPERDQLGHPKSPRWPMQSPQLQERVTIDFEADVQMIANQDPMEFEAIKPNGPYYEYRNAGSVESLQEVLTVSLIVRKAAKLAE